MQRENNDSGILVCGACMDEDIVDMFRLLVADDSGDMLHSIEDEWESYDEVTVAGNKVIFNGKEVSTDSLFISPNELMLIAEKHQKSMKGFDDFLRPTKTERLHKKLKKFERRKAIKNIR